MIETSISLFTISAAFLILAIIVALEAIAQSRLYKHIYPMGAAVWSLCFIVLCFDIIMDYTK